MRRMKPVLAMMVCIMGLSFGGCLFGSDDDARTIHEPAEYLPLEVGRFWRLSMPGITGGYSVRWVVTDKFTEGSQDWYEATILIMAGDIVAISLPVELAHIGDSVVMWQDGALLTLMKKPIEKGAEWGEGDTEVEITGTGITVNAQAGTFKDVISVASSMAGTQQTYWFAPGVGPVKVGIDYEGAQFQLDLEETGVN
jgi:hypothetical protein